jgi:hypothetical protein
MISRIPKLKTKPLFKRPYLFVSSFLINFLIMDYEDSEKSLQKLILHYKMF